MDRTPPGGSAASQWPDGPAYAAVRRLVDRSWEAGRPALVAERSAADDGMVAGVVVRAWVRDEVGLRPMAPDEYERAAGPLLPGVRRPFITVEFHVCSGGRRVVYEVIRGLLSGHGGTCEIDPASPEIATADWMN